MEDRDHSVDLRQQRENAEDREERDADDTFAVIASGASRRTVDGKDVSLLPAQVSPDKAQLARLGLLKKTNSGPIDCPPGLDCEWIPSPYEKLGSDPDKVQAELRPYLASLEKIVAILKGFQDRKEAKW